MNTTSLEMAPRICLKCNYEGQSDNSTCPRCDKRAMRKRKSLRVLGGLFVVLGVLLIGMMTAIGYWYWMWVVEQTGKPGSITRPSLAPERLVAFYVLLGSVAVFGLAAIIKGLYQVFSGKFSLYLVYLILALFAVVLFAGYNLSAMFD